MSRLFHHPVEIVALGDVNEHHTAVPSGQGRQRALPGAMGHVLFKDAPHSGLDQSGHSSPSPRGLFVQRLHQRVVYVESGLHMATAGSECDLRRPGHCVRQGRLPLDGKFFLRKCRISGDFIAGTENSRDSYWTLIGRLLNS